MHNLPLFMEAYYGILKAGASVVPMNVLYKTGEVEYILKDSGAKALLSFSSAAVALDKVALAAAAAAPELQIGDHCRAGEMPGSLSWAATIGNAPTDRAGSHR